MNKPKTGIQFIDTASFEELSRISAGKMIYSIKRKPSALFCLATGNSVVRAYEIFVEQVMKEQIDVSKMRILKLDEWRGVPETDPSTCESFILANIIKPLNIPVQNYFSFDGTAPDAHAECVRVAKVIQEQGPIDLCILGLGKNGHLGLNEPGSYLMPFSHVAILDEKTKTHDMLIKTKAVIECGMTIGMADIMASREVLFLVAGDGKNEAFNKFLKAHIYSDLPASYLWLHPNTVCVYENRLFKS